MNRSRFMMACALHGDAGGRRETGPRREGTTDPVRPCHEQGRFVEALHDIPGLGMSLPEAIAFLVRVEKQRDPER